MSLSQIFPKEFNYEYTKFCTHHNNVIQFCLSDSRNGPCFNLFGNSSLILEAAWGKIRRNGKWMEEASSHLCICFSGQKRSIPKIQEESLSCGILAFSKPSETIGIRNVIHDLGRMANIFKEFFFYLPQHFTSSKLRWVH